MKTEDMINFRNSFTNLKSFKLRLRKALLTNANLLKINNEMLSNSTLEVLKLDIGQNKINDDTIIPFLNKLSQLHQLKKLCLVCDQTLLSDTSIVNITKSALVLTSITEFVLHISKSGKMFTEGSLIALLSAMLKWRDLRVFDFDLPSNFLDDTLYTYIAAFLQASPKLQGLRLTLKNPSQFAMSELFRGISYLTELESLSLLSQQRAIKSLIVLENENIEKFAECITKCEKLTMLELDLSIDKPEQNNLTPLVTALSSLKNFRTLNLTLTGSQLNYVTFRSFVLVAKRLNSHLRELSLMIVQVKNVEELLVELACLVKSLRHLLMLRIYFDCKEEDISGGAQKGILAMVMKYIVPISDMKEIYLYFHRLSYGEREQKKIVLEAIKKKANLNIKFLEQDFALF